MKKKQQVKETEWTEQSLRELVERIQIERALLDTFPGHPVDTKDILDSLLLLLREKVEGIGRGGESS
jgi:hypothetical protein